MLPPCSLRPLLLEEALDNVMKTHSRGPKWGPCEQTSHQQPAPTYQPCEWASFEANPPTSVKPSEDPEQNCSAKVPQNSRSSETINQFYCCFKSLSFVVICFRTIDTNTELYLPFFPSDFCRLLTLPQKYLTLGTKPRSGLVSLWIAHCLPKPIPPTL